MAAFTATSTICADTGATHHLFRISDTSTLIEIHRTSLTAQLPNGDQISAIGAGTLFIPQLPHPLLVYIFLLSLSLLRILSSRPSHFLLIHQHLLLSSTFISI